MPEAGWQEGTWDDDDDDDEVDGGLVGGMGSSSNRLQGSSSIERRETTTDFFGCGACHTWKSEWCLQLINYSTGFFHTL